MSSSTFEVREPESESEKVLDFGLDTCEENGIGMSAHIDGEVPRDHTYTKEPDVEQKEEVKDSEEEANQVDEMEDIPSPKKKGGRQSRVKKSTIAVKGKAKKGAITKKEPAPKKGRKKEILTEEVNAVPEDNANDEKVEADVETAAVAEEPPKTPKRGKKRKIEEKENVIDQSIMEEVQNITEDPATNESSTESSPKKAKPSVQTSKAKKTAKSKAASSDDNEDNANLPKGWVRKTVVRKSGKSAGTVDVYIYSPDGIKFRSKPSIAAYLAKTKSSLKIDVFDFSKKKASSGKTVSHLPKTPVKAKTTPAKIKSPQKKKATSPKKTAKLLVVKLSDSKKKKGAKSEEKGAKLNQSKTPVKKGKAKSTPSKSNKKKKTA